jgi:hypothetical protein
MRHEVKICTVKNTDMQGKMKRRCLHAWKEIRLMYMEFPEDRWLKIVLTYRTKTLQQIRCC